MGLRQVPSAGVTPAASSQVTLPAPSVMAVGSPPQQSLLVVQRLFVTRQPLGGWQIFTPVAAKGAQRRLQQLVQSPQTTPSCTQLPEPEVSMDLQTPAAAPAALEQRPVQQSSLR
jgi:hypothetical protein